MPLYVVRIDDQNGGNLAGEAIEPAIKFQASVYKVQTLSDGGLRVALDLPETAIPQMAMLAECQRQRIYLDVICVEAKSSITNGRAKTH